MLETLLIGIAIVVGGGVALYAIGALVFYVIFKKIMGGLK